MKFSFLIVNYNTEHHILHLLDNLAKQSVQDFEVIIVNNVQNNTMSELLTERAFAFLPKLIQSPQNVGFGRAMNVAANNAVGEHFLITNPDIIINDDDFLKKLAIEMDKYPNYGAMTCQILDDLGRDTSEFDTFALSQTFGLSHSPRWLLGAFLFFRKEIYEQLSGFDKDFFMYCEDEDICYRVQKMGLKLEKINSLSVRHIGGVSEPIRGYDFFYRQFRSQILFSYKHLSQKDFEQLLLRLNKKSIQKYRIYKILHTLIPSRYLAKLNKWKALNDVIQKTLNDGVEWLYFRINGE